MPHISIKMLKGRTEEQKEKVANALANALVSSLGCSRRHVSVTVEDYTPQQWQDVFEQEITKKQDKLYISPGYDPKDLL